MASLWLRWLPACVVGGRRTAKPGGCRAVQREFVAAGGRSGGADPRRRKEDGGVTRRGRVGEVLGVSEEGASSGGVSGGGRRTCRCRRIAPGPSSMHQGRPRAESPGGGACRVVAQCAAPTAIGKGYSTQVHPGQETADKERDTKIEGASDCQVCPSCPSCPGWRASGLCGWGCVGGGRSAEPEWVVCVGVGVGGEGERRTCTTWAPTSRPSVT